MSSRIGIEPPNAISPRPSRLRQIAPQLADRKVRDGYVSRQVRTFLATQIRALRGRSSQAEFGKRIGKPQSVVSRLENQGTGINIQTLLDIARKLDLGLLIRFVDHPTFLKVTDDYSGAALAPGQYQQKAIDDLVQQEEADVVKSRDAGTIHELASSKIAERDQSQIPAPRPLLPESNVATEMDEQSGRPYEPLPRAA